MSLVDNEWGFRCSWCGREVEQVTDPDMNATRPVGICEADGIVFVAIGAYDEA